MNTALILELMAEEGTILYVYDDATSLPIVPGSVCIGHPTIGVGRALDVHGISADEAQFLLNDDLATLNAALAGYPWWPPLGAVRQFICIDMAFTLGLRGLLGFPRMIAALFQGDYERAAAEMLASHWARQAPARARRLAQAMRTGHFPEATPDGGSSPPAIG